MQMYEQKGKDVENSIHFDVAEEFFRLSRNLQALPDKILSKDPQACPNFFELSQI